MILTRTPLRITLGGGGTDLPFYADVHGGSLVTASINRYIYITVSPRLQRNIKLNYSRTEIVEKAKDVRHPLIRECMKLTGTEAIEVHSTAEIPSGTGLGSSAAFTVGLLNGLYYHSGDIMSRYKLAEDASHVIMDVLGEPCGKQDQYACAFGGINHLMVGTDGRVTVNPIDIHHEDILTLERNLMIFYLGGERSASELLGQQRRKAKKPGADIYDYYHKIKEIGEKSLKCLRRGDVTEFGRLMDDHWRLKREITDSMTNSRIDRLYSIAVKHKALGGKLIGAGGGGFLMVYAEKGRDRLLKVMESKGLTYTPFKFDFDGSRIVYDGAHY